MKPWRLEMVNSLVQAYRLDRSMKMFAPAKAKVDDLWRFHDQGYIEFLEQEPDESDDYRTKFLMYNFGTDNPHFEGILDFSLIVAGASIACAIELNSKASEIAINWSGGLHHSLYNKFSGFCPVADVTLAILELLKHQKRVLYVDIDAHHGDGVEKSFYGTNRVFTASFHKYAKGFFPESGYVCDIGTGVGKGFAVNVPLHDGIDDSSFVDIFKKVVNAVMGKFQATAIVMQCGVDSLAGDEVGAFNLTTKGHSTCVQFMKDKNLPLMLLGGGGYLLTNVARCWAIETAVACGVELAEDIPYHNYWYDYERPLLKLHTEPLPMENKNSKAYLEAVFARVVENLKQMEAAPSVTYKGG